MPTSVHEWTKCKLIEKQNNKNFLGENIMAVVHVLEAVPFKFRKNNTRARPTSRKVGTTYYNKVTV